MGDANYGSRGGSVNVEMELESTLVGEPQKLRERIRQLFGVVRDSLTEELNGNGAQLSKGTHSSNGHTNGHSDGNGNAANNGNGASNPRPATASQIRALNAISKAQRLNLDQHVRERYGLSQPEDLNIKEASQLIDQLKQKE